MPQPPELAFESTRTLTPSEFHAWSQRRPAWDLNHYELLDGKVLMTPPAGYPHGLIEARLTAIFAAFVAEHGLGYFLGSSQGFELPTADTIEPDGSFVSTRRWEAMPAPRPGEFLRVVPDLILEILSPSTAAIDRVRKRRLYERTGVREYWLVDPRIREITVLVRRGDAFDDGTTYGEGTTARSEVVANLTVEVASIFPPAQET